MSIRKSKSNEIKDWNKDNLLLEFYTAKINHEIKNPLITLRSKFEEFHRSNKNFYSLILNKNPELELENILNFINIMINKIFNICDFISESNSQKIENSKIYLKECLEGVYSLLKTDFDNFSLNNQVKFKPALLNFSNMEFIYNDERKFKQLLINSFYFLKSFNLFGSSISVNTIVTENSIKISFKLTNKFKSKGKSNLLKDLVNINNDSIISDLGRINFFQNIDNYTNYFYVLITKLSKILKIDMNIQENHSNISIEYTLNREIECKDHLNLPLSEKETLKLSLRELCFDKNQILKNYDLNLKKEIIEPITKKKSKNENSIPVDPSSLNKVKNNLKEIRNDDPSSKPKGFNHVFFNIPAETESKNNKEYEVCNSSDGCQSGNKKKTNETRVFPKVKKFSHKNISYNNLSNGSPRESPIKKKLKILVVDDEPSQRMAIKRLIKSIESDMESKYTFEIIEACDGIEALSKLMNEINENPYNNTLNCIIFDENMKYLNGSKTIDLIKHCKSMNEFLRNTFIVSLSSHYSLDFSNYVSKCGADMSISKPLEKGLLREIINQVIITNN